MGVQASRLWPGRIGHAKPHRRCSVCLIAECSRAHTVIKQKGYFGTKGHPPFDGKLVTRDSDPHVSPDVQGAGGRVPREAGGGVLGEPWTHGHSREPVPWGPQSAEQGTGPEASISLPSRRLPRPQAQDYMSLLQQTIRAPQPRPSQPGDRGGSQGTHAPNRRKLPTCPRSNASVHGVSFRFLKT